MGLLTRLAIPKDQKKAAEKLLVLQKEEQMELLTRLAQ